MAEVNRTVVSGIQPTAGGLHLGNYAGAVKNWVPLQNTHDAFFFIADLHALTVPLDASERRTRTDDLLFELQACGVDPDKATLFVQSLMPEHAELFWHLACVTPYGELSRMTQFKDKAQEAHDAEAVNLGLFSYPVLQAADILAYRASLVPVGRDQEQHLELSRTVARRFNQRFGEIFPIPQPLFTATPRIMSTADPSKKMSKSLGGKHCLGLFEAESGLRAKIRAAVVDSGDLPGEVMSPGVVNLVEILRACGRDDLADEFADDYRAGRRQYGELKAVVADALVALTAPIRARFEALRRDRATVARETARMSDRARTIAGETLRDVRQALGLPARSARVPVPSGWAASASGC